MEILPEKDSLPYSYRGGVLQEIEGVLHGGPSTVDPEERFTTCARAANEQKPALPEMKGAGWRLD